MSEITIRGRIATTSLRRGETVTVEHTEHVDRLIGGGFVEVVFAEGGSVPAAPKQPAGEPSETVDQPDHGGDVDIDAAPEAEAIARRKPARKRSS